MPTVAFDTGPLHGPITGIGRAVDGLRSGLDALDGEVALVPYVLSFRAALAPGTVRLPFPAALALRTWARWGAPRVDRHLPDVDLVHGTNYVVPPTRRPRLVSVYDCWALDNAESVGTDVRLAMRVLERSIAEGVAVHASSHATARRLREIFPGVDVTVVHLGPPTFRSTHSAANATEPAGSDVSFDPTHGAPYALAIGTIEKRKNLPTLVCAWSRIADDELHLVLAGSPGDDTAAVERVVADLAPDVRRRIHVVGRVDDATARTLLRRARVLVYPSLDEGFGFPLLEAMAAGVPIVASDAGSIPEVAGDAAVLVGAHDVDALAGAIGRVHCDDSLRTALVTAGGRRLGQFSWERTAREMLDLYRRIASAR